MTVKVYNTEIIRLTVGNTTVSIMQSKMAPILEEA